MLTFAEREAGAAPVLQLAPGVGGAALDPAAARHAAALDQYVHRSEAPFRDATIQPGAAIGSHAPLDAMTNVDHDVICDRRVIRASGTH